AGLHGCRGTTSPFLTRLRTISARRVSPRGLRRFCGALFTPWPTDIEHTARAAAGDPAHAATRSSGVRRTRIARTPCQASCTWPRRSRRSVPVLQARRPHGRSVRVCPETIGYVLRKWERGGRPVTADGAAAC